MARVTFVIRRAFAAAPRLCLAVAILSGWAAAAGVSHRRMAAEPVPTARSISMPPAVGAPGGPATSSDGLKTRIAEMEQQLREHPADLGASILLADALVRQARATGEGRPSGRAASVLEQTLKDNPGSYDALRLLGAVYLSLHRFAGARDVGAHARDMRPDDAWNYGVIGDAQLELGNYDEAFAMFDRMMELRPGPAAYARVAYAREMRGNLVGALEAMQMAFSATPMQDPEARAWYATQLGELQLKLGDADAADREFRRARFAFAHYPLAEVGAGKARLALGDRTGALAIFLDEMRRTPTVDLAARIGDMYRSMGRRDDAEHFYALAEDLAGPMPAQTEATLALFLAEHDRKLTQAVALAERVAATRHDIGTEHALAWAYFKVGRINDAKKAIDRALRTGSRDVMLLSHAATIRAATSRPT
jgi:tetratricopeptide (TPR) repeat protein